MSVHDESTASRQFVASPGFFGLGPKRRAGGSYLLVYGFVALMVVLIVGVAVYARHGMGQHTRSSRHGSPIVVGAAITHIIPVILVLLLVGYGAYYWWHKSRRFVVRVTSNGLTVNKRPGDVFPFSDMQLGPWAYGMSEGTALHLHRGRDRFVLGGRDHRVPTGTRLDAPPVPGVDAWLWAKDFDELLTLVGRPSGPDVRPGPDVGPPAPTGSIRCLLFPNPLLVQTMGAFSIGKKTRLLRSATEPRLAIDVDGAAIRVIDPNSNALVASAPLAQVTATPTTYRPRPWWTGWSGNYISDGMYRTLSITPMMLIDVPGFEPLSISCRDSANSAGTQRRFSWDNGASVVRRPADYAVSGADWLVLVEKVGLAPHLERHGERG
jgi:hypothetical protein